MLIFLVFLIVNTFKIISIVAGRDTEITVQEPQPWNSNQFKVTLDNPRLPRSLILKFENGRWQALSEKKEYEKGIESLEVSSIGYKIARYWCQQLEEQLENFQLTF